MENKDDVMTEVGKGALRCHDKVKKEKGIPPAAAFVFFRSGNGGREASLSLVRSFYLYTCIPPSVYYNVIKARKKKERNFLLLLLLFG